jgi:hypothetical protein
MGRNSLYNTISKKLGYSLSPQPPFETGALVDRCVAPVDRNGIILAIVFVFWLLSRGDGARSLTFLEVEKNQDTTKNQINPWLAFGEFYAVVLLANWLSQWEAWLGVLIYLLGSGLILWQAWQIFHKK